MRVLDLNVKPQVVRICGKLTLFKLDDDVYAFASKRVANDVLAGESDVYITGGHEIHIPGYGRIYNYLATPNIW